MIRFVLTAALAAAFGLGVLSSASWAGHHEPVIQVFTVAVKPGKLEDYQEAVEELRSVMERLGSPGVVRMWRATVAGPDSGNVIVGVEYPNQDSWAADTTKLQADEEYQDIIDDLHKIRRIESNAMWRDISPNPAPAGKPGSGTVLAITAVAVEPGKVAEYRKRVGRAQGISERLGLQSRPRMWHAVVAGENTGGVVVGVEYPSLTAYMKETGKLAGDAEWQKLLAGLGEIRTLVGRWLYEEITP